MTTYYYPNMEEALRRAKKAGRFCLGAGMDDGITALDLDTSDACTDVFLHVQSLVRISREVGLQMG